MVMVQACTSPEMVQACTSFQRGVEEVSEEDSEAPDDV